MHALRHGNTEFAKILIENGADVNAKDNDGKIAFDYANDSIKKLLLQQIEKINNKKINFLDKKF